MQKVVTGVVSALEPRSNDWVAVHIQVPGKQYPVKLSTKRPDILGTAQQVVGQVVDALYNEEQSDQINPHNGQPYINRYLEQLAPAGTIPPPVVPVQQPLPQAVPQQAQYPQAAPSQFPQVPVQPAPWPQPPVPQLPPQPGIGNLQPQLPPQPAPQPVQTSYMVTDDERENRIMRQAATKVAASFLPMLHEDERNLGSLIRIAEQLLKYYKEGVSWETAPPQMPNPVPAAVGAPDGDPGPEPGDPRSDEFPPGY